MARATRYPLYQEVAGAGADGDTVVAGLHAAAGDGDAVGFLDMDAVCVGAVSGSQQFHSLDPHILAAVQPQVVGLAID